MVVRRDRERGANLVEFALIAPLLIMLVMGIIDFGWILSTQQDARHGAREAARLAAVNTDSTANMTTLVCSSMNVSNGATVTFNTGGGAVGNSGSIILVAPVALAHRILLPALCRRHLPDHFHRGRHLPT